MLGPVGARIGGRELVSGPPLQRLVLARLALTPGQAAGLDELIDVMWPGPMHDTGRGGPPRTAAGQVHKYICQLRKELDPCRDSRCCRQALTRRGSEYFLALEREQIDSALFADLVRQARRYRQATETSAAAQCFQTALALWHGNPLGGLPDQRAQAWRDRLTQEWLTATEEHNNAELDLHHHPHLLAELAKLTADHPYHEPFWAQRMLALYRSSRQHDALTAYHEIETILDEECLQPSRMLSRLRDRILGLDPELMTLTPRTS